MANPNIVQVTNIQGNSAGYGITTSNGIFIGAVPSDKVFKLNTITVTNTSTSNTQWVSVWRDCQTVVGPDGGTSLNGYLAYQIDIPAKSALSILDKSSSIYLNESHRISAVSNGTSLQLHASWEEIS